jgi:hypothetical protein
VCRKKDTYAEFWLKNSSSEHLLRSSDEEQISLWGWKIFWTAWQAYVWATLHIQIPEKNSSIKKSYPYLSKDDLDLYLCLRYRRLNVREKTQWQQNIFNSMPQSTVTRNADDMTIICIEISIKYQTKLLLHRCSNTSRHYKPKWHAYLDRILHDARTGLHALLLLLLLLLLLPLCSVFTIMYLKQTMFLEYTVLQLFCIYSLCYM